MRSAAPVALLSILCALGATPVARQGSATVAGRVVDGRTGQPIAGAVVTVVAQAGDSASESRSTLTGDDGQFTFTRLRAGSVMLGAERPGYLEGQYGRLRARGFGRPLPVDEGSRHMGLTITMWRHSIIRGRVLDKSGEPVQGVEVTALATQPSANYNVPLAHVEDHQTNDLGEYEIALAPGTYAVAVMLQATTSPARTNPRGEYEGSLIAPFPVFGLTTSDGAWWLHLAVGTPLPRKTADGRVLTYVTTFHPNVTAFSAARTVSLGAGEERSDVDIQLAEVPTCVVSGVVDMTSVPAGRVLLTLLSDGAKRQGVVSDIAYARADGTFRFLGVTPGRYTLQAARIFIGEEVMPADRDPLFATRPLSVTSADITGLDVRLHPGVRVTGRIEFDESPEPDDSTQLALADRGGAALVTARSQGSAQTTFEFRSVAPGRYTLAAVNGQWHVLNMTMNGRELPDDPIEVTTAHIANLVVRLTKASTSLTGVLTNRSGFPTADAEIVLFPVDRTQWDTDRDERRFHAQRADAAGRFQLRDLPAGEYFAAAVDESQMDDWSGTAFLDAIARTATRVQIAPGRPAVLNLRVGGE
jgi:protocatechuate 3,4-dioxygenase beta subunit